MAFNLYFAGEFSNKTEELIEKQGNYRLLSYYMNKRLVERRIQKGLPSFIDSGAFSAHTRKVEVDVDEYIDYLNERDEFISVAAQLDTIPGEFGKPKTEKQLAEAPVESWENYLYMIDKVKSPEKILPIYHQFEDFVHFERMVDYGVPYIGISPSNEVTVNRKIPCIEKCFNIIAKSGRKDVKVHAFGMTSLNLLEQYPFYSADSTSWIMTCANGGIMSKYGTILVSEKSKGKKNYVGNFPLSFQEEVSNYVKKYGHTLEQLATDYVARGSHNIMYLTEWAENYKYKPKQVSQGTLF